MHYKNKNLILTFSTIYYYKVRFFILFILFVRLIYSQGDLFISGNSGPVADAGRDIKTLSKGSIFLDGSRSYVTDGSTIKYQWIFAPGLVLNSDNDFSQEISTKAFGDKYLRSVTTYNDVLDVKLADNTPGTKLEVILKIKDRIGFEDMDTLIVEYFDPTIPKEDPIVERTRVKTYDRNIQIPAILAAYRTPGFGKRDAYVLDMISSYLSGGESSVLYKKLVDDQEQALQVAAINITQQDYSMFTFFALPLGNVSLDTLIEEMDEEISKVQNELISERDYQKLQNQFESQFVNSNSSIAGIASSLATYYMLYGDVNLINKEIDIYRSISREEIRDVAKRYLNTNQRVEIEYLPEESK